MASLSAARLAKAKVLELLAGESELNGVGIARHGDGYQLKVNLRQSLPGRVVPSEVDGVPVRVEVVGRITKRAGRRGGDGRRGRGEDVGP